MKNQFKCTNLKEVELVRNFYKAGNSLDNQLLADKHMQRCISCTDYHLAESRELFKELPVGRAIGKTSIPRSKIRSVISMAVPQSV